MYSPDTLAEINETHSTYIVIRIRQIDQKFCGGNVRYNTAVYPSDNSRVLIFTNQTILMHNITGLKENTTYMITTMASRWPKGDVVQMDVIEWSTLESPSNWLHIAYDYCIKGKFDGGKAWHTW